MVEQWPGGRAPTLWSYERAPGRWYGHVDWHDRTPLKREGPFDTEDEAAVVVSRMNGLEPPPDMLAAAERRWALKKAKEG